MNEDGGGLLKISRMPSGEPEIFVSLQGEGATCGTPSVFVRLALCNLHCDWCDTRYTWDWTQYAIKSGVVALSAEDVAERALAAADGEQAREAVRLAADPRLDCLINGYSMQAAPAESDGSIGLARGLIRPRIERVDSEPLARSASAREHGQPEASLVRTVVITGGEPLLQQTALEGLLELLAERGMRIEIETNGTVRPNDRLQALVDQWNVSPKLESSGNTAREREDPQAIEWLAGQPRAFFKFVVVDPDDLDDVVALVARYRLPPDRVLLMPEARDAATLNARSVWLVEPCQALGYRFSTRLHILLWGDVRGR